MKSNTSRGFTLIELLVVIAIIGILSAVVLASLSTARSKGSDAAIRSNLSSIQTEAEIYYSNNNRYNADGATLTSGSCTVANTMFMADTSIKNAVAGAESANGAGVGVNCRSDAGGTVYAIASILNTTPATYFCVDSTGNATTTGATISTTNC